MAVRPGIHLYHDAAERLIESAPVEHYVSEVAHAAAKIAADTMPYLTGAHARAVFATDDEFGSTSSTWHIVEFGSYHNRPSRAITNAAEKAGMEFDPR
jgi:hypothetical protein